MIVAGVEMPKMTANRFEKYCESIRDVLWDDMQFYGKLKHSCNLLDIILDGNLARDKAKDSSIFSKAKGYLEAESGIFRIEFEGYWQDKNKSGVPPKSGLFCVYECGYNEQKKTVSIKQLIYIGEADNARERIANHEKYDRWLQHIGPGNTLCFSFGAVININRNRCKAAMIYVHKPPANIEQNDFFPFDPTNLYLSGNIALLTQNFEVNRT
jgi:hypothetical protein